MKEKEYTYRVRFRYDGVSAGTEIKLTEEEAIRINNEAPGVLERIPDAQPQKPAPKPTKEEP